MKYPIGLNSPAMRNLLAAALAMLGLASSLAAADKPAAAPNVIVILADDLGYADLSLHGNTEVATPRIDSLAKGGVHCVNAYVSCPVCSPTRAGFLTGRYQQRFGHEFNPALLKNGGQGQGLPVEERTIADRMRAAGYATSLIGKWHQGEEDQFHPLNRGFDEFFGFLLGWHSFLPSSDPEWGPVYRGRQRVEVDSYLTRALADEACQVIERRKDGPFFIYLAFNAVHTPMEAPQTTEAKFAGVQNPTRRTYLAMLAELDDAVGKVLDKLRAAGLEERTLIFFLSDNGGPTTKYSPNGARNTPLRGSKGDTWDGGIRVPFFVQWKGHLPAGVVYEPAVISLDISATALAAAGAPTPTNARATDATAKGATAKGAAPSAIAAAPAGAGPALGAIGPALDGVDLLPYLTGYFKAIPHEFLFWRFGEQMAVRSGDWKLVRPSMGKGEYEAVATTPMLFNLRKDPGERHDLAAEQPAEVRRLQAAWDSWNAQIMAPRWPATLKGKAFVEQH